MDQQHLLDDLVALLDLEELDLNIFRGHSPEESRVRVFGGQVAAQALVAAGRTVEGATAHSLHAYFLRAGDPSIPILYEVCLLYTSPSPRDKRQSRMPSSA